MKRRQFVRVAGMALGFPALPAFAQKDMPLVAVVVPGSASQASSRIVALRAGLQEAGLVEGTHYRLALRFADGVAARMPEIILEAGALKPRVVVSAGLGGAVKRLLPDVPHVFTAIAADPIKIGLIDNYARPGGNTTGNVMTRGGEDGSMTQKRIDYFRQLVPNFKRLGFIGTSTNPVVVDELAALRSMGSRMGFELVHHPLQRIEDIEPALAATAQDGADALYLSGEPLLIANLSRTVQAVAASGIPAVGTYPDFGRAGFLMSYAVDVDDGFRRAGLYVARILRGEKPGDLPVEQASKFTLVVNAATAKRLGITLPTTFVADEVTD